MKIFAISDIHGALKPVKAASEMIRESDIVVISGDLTHRGSKEDASELLVLIEKYNTNVIGVHGNWDRIGVMDSLEERGYNTHAKGRMIDGIGFFGVGGSSPTPINTPSEYSEEEIMEFLKEGYKSVKDAEMIILISHAPPRGARDRMFLGMRVGSTSVRDFLTANRVNLCICGHIHEARGYEYFENTMVVNPGSFKKGKYASIEISDNISIKLSKMKKREFK